MQIAREHGIKFMETSAKNNINIERAFEELAEAILNKTPSGRPDPSELPDRIRAVNPSPGIIFSLLSHK